MKFAILLIAGLMSPGPLACAQDVLPIGTANVFKKLVFEYSPYEGEGALTCVHKQDANNPYMFAVDCGQGQRKFTVTLAITQRSRMDPAPRTYLEIIYSMIDNGTKSHPGPSFSSQMTLVFLEEKTGLHKVFMSQGVENGLARLAVDLEL